MVQSFSIYHTKSNQDIDLVLNLNDCDSKVNNPSLDAEPVATSIPDITLSGLARDNLNITHADALQYNAFFVPAVKNRSNLKENGIH